MAANKEMPEVKKNDLTNREASALTDAEKSLALETKTAKTFDLRNLKWIN